VWVRVGVQGVASLGGFEAFGWFVMRWRWLVPTEVGRRRLPSSVVSRPSAEAADTLLCTDDATRDELRI